MPTTRSQSKKFDAAQIPAVGQSNIEATFHSMIEWMVFDYSETAAVKRVNWKEFLNEIRGVEGCSHITFACPKEDPEILWVIIGKDLKFRSREPRKTLTKYWSNRVVISIAPKQLLQSRRDCYYGKKIPLLSK